MIDVTATVLIRRPLEAVSAYMTDPANDTAWIRALTAARQLTPPPPAKGMRVERAAKFMGRSMTYTTEVIEWSPAERVQMQTMDGPYPMAVTYSFAGEDGGTRVSIRNHGGSGVMFKLAGPLIGRMVNGRVKGDLAQLKEILEG